MYKAAGRAFLVHGGAGSHINNNLIVNGGIGIFQTNAAAKAAVSGLALYDNGTLKRGDKGDYVWRTEGALGVHSEEQLAASAFAQRFPTFRQMMAVNSSVAGWASPTGSNFASNLFLNMSVGGVCFLTSYHSANGTRCDDELPLNGGDRFIDRGHSVQAQWGWFPGADHLAFVHAATGIDTNDAGLQCDEWRTSMPTKATYRAWVRRTFEAVPSDAAGGSYTPEAAELRASLHSGRQLVEEFTTACPPLKKTDCVGVWLAWGECEADGRQVMRYTVEQKAMAGGSACPREDGEVMRAPC